jgi:hypothetical protein
MRGAFVAGVLLLAGLAAGQEALTYRQLHGMLKSSVEQGLRDRDIADYLKSARLGFSLSDAQIEEFQGWGIGPRTLKVLQELQTRTQGLPEAKREPPKREVGPPPPSAEEQKRIIAEARNNALNYTGQLPDYICLQITRRYFDPSGLELDWLKYDEVKTRVSYFDRRENYEVISVDNQITNKSIEELGGATSTGEFGTMLAELFDPKTAAEFTWARHSLLRGRSVYVFQIRVPRQRSSWRLSVERTDEIIAGYTGLVYIDKETERVLRLYMRAENIPPDFPMREAETRLDYDFIPISGTEHLLPLKARIRMRSGKMRSRNEVEFRMYRKFSSEATITFEDVDDLPPLPEEEPEPGEAVPPPPSGRD